MIRGLLVEFVYKTKVHRLHGPARIWYDSHQEWWINGKRHRIDGPAVIFSTGYKEWWVKGKLIKESDE